MDTTVPDVTNDTNDDMSVVERRLMINDIQDTTTRLRTLRRSIIEDIMMILASGDFHVVSAYADDNYDRAVRNSLQTYNPVKDGLSKEKIEALPTRRCTKKDVGTCSVCLDDWKPKMKVTILPCDHFFHKKCIGKWLKSSTTCPMCRHECE